MDATDVKILDLLKNNSRVKASFIGERINMSVSAVIERIKKLESTGIIRQYTILLNDKKIGKDVVVFLSVQLDHPKHNDDFIENISMKKDIIECHNITGDFDFILKVVTESTQELERIIHEIKNLPEVALTRTQVVLATCKYETTVLPERKQFK